MALTLNFHILPSTFSNHIRNQLQQVDFPKKHTKNVLGNAFKIISCGREGGIYQWGEEKAQFQWRTQLSSAWAGTVLQSWWWSRTLQQRQSVIGCRMHGKVGMPLDLTTFFNWGYFQSSVGAEGYPSSVLPEIGSRYPSSQKADQNGTSWCPPHIAFSFLFC